MERFAKPLVQPGAVRTRATAAHVLVLLVLSSTGAVLGQEPWRPFPCPAAPDPQGVHEREPEPPAPALESDEQVIRAFERQIRTWFFGSRWRAVLDELGLTAAAALGVDELLPPYRGDDAGRGALVEAMRADAISYRVEPVADWRPGRLCGTPDERTAFYLEAHFDGRRLTALLSGTGRLRSWSRGALDATEPPPSPPLPTLDKAAALLTAHAGGPIEHVQYVLATGYPGCSSIPCIAAHRSGTLYLLEAPRTIGHRLFAFPLDPRPEKEIVPSPGGRCIGAPCPGDPWLVAVGDRWLAGEIVRVLGR